MLDCQISMLNYIGTMYLMSGELTERSGNGHFVHVPYNTFRTKTRYIILALLTDRSWTSLVELLGDDELRRDEFLTQPGRLHNKDFIEARVQRALEQKTCEHWLEVLADRQIPAAPVNDLSHAFADPQVLARSMRVTVPMPDGSIVEQPGNPIKMSGVEGDVFLPPPPVGRDTVQVLREVLGLGAERLADLSKAGVIACA